MKRRCRVTSPVFGSLLPPPRIDSCWAVHPPSILAFDEEVHEILSPNGESRCHDPVFSHGLRRMPTCDGHFAMAAFDPGTELEARADVSSHPISESRAALVRFRHGGQKQLSMMNLHISAHAFELTFAPDLFVDTRRKGTGAVAIFGRGYRSAVAVNRRGTWCETCRFTLRHHNGQGRQPSPA